MLALSREAPPTGPAHGYFSHVHMHNPTSSGLLEQLETAAGGKLTRRDDLAVLLILGEPEDRRQTLADLSFHAKAAHRIYGVMDRVGRNGDGYDKLEREFRINLDRTTALIGELLRDAPADVVRRLTADYLDLTQASLRNLLALMYDLSWYKNWLIDGRQRGGRL